MFKEFKEFALKGNLIDLAVAFVMGAAFTKLAGAFIEDIIMPWVGLLSNGKDFSNLFLPLADGVTAVNLADAKKQGAVFAYGNFITVALNFIIVAFVMYLVVKGISRAKALTARKQAAGDVADLPPPSSEELLLMEIRDLLKNKG